MKNTYDTLPDTTGSILAVANMEEDDTETRCDKEMYHIDGLSAYNFAPEDYGPYENLFITASGERALFNRAKNFVFHSLHNALASYRCKSVTCIGFINHVKKRTGLTISFGKNNGGIIAFFPRRRTILSCFHSDLGGDFNYLSFYDSDCNPDDADGFRIWLRAQLLKINKELEDTLHTLNIFPEAVKLHNKEQYETKKRLEEFRDSIMEKIPYIGNMAGQI